MRVLPIGHQTFSELIEKDYLYVDKTESVWRLVNHGKYYFFARPRRFGKSLLLSTLRSYFEGNSDLFKGLFIHQKEKIWTKSPIIHINFGSISYRSGKAVFQKSILFNLNYIAKAYDLTLVESSISDTFQDLVIQLHEKFGKVVILVDEYDKALVDLLENEQQFEDNRAVLNELYGNFKSLDNYLRFVFITGVSRFAKVGIFSGMNNLNDITMDAEFASIVGFTQTELTDNFAPYLQAVQQSFDLPMDQIMKTIKIWYNGFSWDGQTTLYNPFSILNFLSKKVLGNYWFSTGTPTFLMDLIKKQQQLPAEFEGVVVQDLVGSSMRYKTLPLIPLLFQTGYLTIEKTIKNGMEVAYQLNYPNQEVRHSFITFIVAAFVDKDEFYIQADGIKLKNALIAGDTDKFIDLLISFFSDIPSKLHLPAEAYYHSLVYLILRMVGVNMTLEKATNIGFIDGVIELKDKIYIIEFKFATNKRVKNVKTLSKKALRQIKDRKYYEAYTNRDKPIILFGIGFLDKHIDGITEILD